MNKSKVPSTKVKKFWTIDEAQDEYQCVICLEIPDQPAMHVLGCKTLYCLHCIVQVQERCVSCQKVIPKEDLGIHKEQEQFLTNKVLIECNCNEKIKAIDFNKHYHECKINMALKEQRAKE